MFLPSELVVEVGVVVVAAAAVADVVAVVFAAVGDLQQQKHS